MESEQNLTILNNIEDKDLNTQIIEILENIKNIQKQNSDKLKHITELMQIINDDQKIKH